MTIISLDVSQIADLDTPVAQSGSIQTATGYGDPIFDYIIGIVMGAALSPDA
ncbi:hypothetical protein [Sphingomonas bacterium]|uniref:hypothetical protein n=1 Tax=Sphingomonas bacterium TaxID=1895847 RepID=UPI001574FD34|nr:hypothetical protein [Sphingomonas bacterium]